MGLTTKTIFYTIKRKCRFTQRDCMGRQRW